MKKKPKTNLFFFSNFSTKISPTKKLRRKCFWNILRKRFLTRKIMFIVFVFEKMIMKQFQERVNFLVIWRKYFEDFFLFYFFVQRLIRLLHNKTLFLDSLCPAHSLPKLTQTKVFHNLAFKYSQSPIEVIEFGLKRPDQPALMEDYLYTDVYAEGPVRNK